MSNGDFNEQTPQIRLVGGVNFSTWPDLKWARGAAHAKALESNFIQWSASAPVSVEGVLRDDRQGINLVARAPHGIPKHEWALLLGDALHNFRSAFDALAWGMAHFNDAQPSKPKSIYFPVCSNRNQWNDALKAWVGELPPELQNRLQIVQPYNYTPDGIPSILRMLHDLDIQDKHKDFLTVSVDMNGLSLDGAALKYEKPDVAAAPNLELRTDAKFEDGVILGTLHAGATIEMLGKFILRPSMRVQLTWEGQTFDVESILAQFTTETRRYLDILMHGLAPIEEDADAWEPLDVNHVQLQKEP